MKDMTPIIRLVISLNIGFLCGCGTRNFKDFPDDYVENVISQVDAIDINEALKLSYENYRYDGNFTLNPRLLPKDILSKLAADEAVVVGFPGRSIESGELGYWVVGVGFVYGKKIKYIVALEDSFKGSGLKVVDRRGRFLQVDGFVVERLDTSGMRFIGESMIK